MDLPDEIVSQILESVIRKLNGKSFVNIAPLTNSIDGAPKGFLLSLAAN